MTPDDWAMAALVVIALAFLAYLTNEPKGPRPA